MADFPIYRLVKGSTLSFTEMDDNLRWLSATMSASVVTITGSTYVVGNLNVSNGITGSLFGTSSWAVSASYTINAISASYVSGSGAIVTNLTSSNDALINGLTIGRGNSVANFSNVAIGTSANSLLDGVASTNTSIGYISGQSNIASSANTFLGWAAGNATTGGNNTFIGSGAGRLITSGIGNIIIGRYTGIGSLTNNYNTIIGHINGSLTNVSNNIILSDGQGNIQYRWDGIQNNISGGLNVTGGSITGSNALITGTITAQTLLVQTITSSITYSSGSNIFGNKTTDTHQFTGSVLAPSITGSLQGTSSWAVSASWAPSVAGTTLNGSGYVSMSGTTVSYVSAIPNSSLANSTITIQGSTTALGGSVNVINGTGFVKSSGTSITYDNSTYYLASNPNGYTSNAGTITSVTVSPGTGMSGGGTLTGAGGTLTLTNSAPDQTVVLNSGTGISVTGTYPNFTISSTGTAATISSYIATGSVTASVNTDVTASFKITSGSRTLLTLTNDSKLVIGTPGEFIDYQLEVSGAIKADYLYCNSNGSIASSLYGTGQLLEGAADQPVVFLESTWNTTAAARGIEYRVINTASSGSSKLLNLFVDGVSMFNVNRVGNVGVGSTNAQTKVEVYSDADDRHFSAVGSAPSLNLLDANVNATIVGTVGLATNVDNFIQDTVPGDLCISARGSANASATIMFASGSTMTAFISGSGDMYIKGTLTQGSTRNIKQNIAPINNALSTVIEMQGVTYDKKDGSATNEPGFIAEDLYTILPSLVSLNKNGDPYGVKYTNLTAYLVEAIKELKKEIDILKNK